MKIIAAIGRNGELGRNGNLVWHISADLRRFKALTSGGTVIMGRKTWESLPKRPLPKRRNIVVSRNPEYHAEGAELFTSLSDALAAAGEQAFVIGGEQLYRAALPVADTLELTLIDADAPDADAWFPLPDPQVWELVAAVPQTDDPDAPNYCFATYKRKAE